MPLENKREIAETTGYSERTITSWMKEGLPVHSQGGRGRETLFDPPQVIAWMIQKEVAKYLPKDGDGEAVVYEVERARLTKAQADHEELKVQELRGSMIRSEVVERVQGGMVSSFRARMLSLPTKAAPQVAGMADEGECEQLLTDFVHEALDELSDFDPDAYIPAGDAAGQAAAEDDGEPVGGREPRPEPRGKRGARKMAH